MSEKMMLLKTMLNDQGISFGCSVKWSTVISIMYTYQMSGLELPGMIVVHPTKAKDKLLVHADREDKICIEAIEAYVHICLILKKKNATNNGKLYRDVPTPQDCVENNKVCCVCEQPLGKCGGMAGTGMCGPCCTGEADTQDEFGVSW